MSPFIWPYAKAHGVTLRAVAGYAAVWAFIAITSRISVTALGLQFAPGSNNVDTVAVLLLIVPGAIIARCIRSQATSLESTRSRAPQPSQLLWGTVLALAASTGPLITLPFLHPAINAAGFLADSLIALGACLTLGGLTNSSAAGAGTFLALALISSPQLLPWNLNVIYNADLTDVSVPLGVSLLLIGALAAGMPIPRQDRAKGYRSR